MAISRVPVLALLGTLLAANAGACAPGASSPGQAREGAARSDGAPPAVVPAAPTTSARARAAPRPANVEALQTALEADGYHPMIMHREGRVYTIIMREPRASEQAPREQLLAVLRSHGALLGYGVLGSPSLVADPTSAGGVTVVTGTVGAKGLCPTVAIQGAFDAAPPTETAPFRFAFGCPGVDDDHIRFERDAIARIAAKPTSGRSDPFASWLTDLEKITVVSAVTRTSDMVAATVAAPPVTGDRVATVRAFAERAARQEKLPPLDAMDLGPLAAPAGDARRLEDRFTELTLRLSRTSSEGPCIEPSVHVRLSANAITAVAVTCAREPKEGAPPPDGSRPLPAAAAGALPYVMMCELVSGATNTHQGRVIDSRGHVLTFNEGPLLQTDTIAELVGLVRLHRHYEGTLPAAEVDRLVALTPQASREPVQSKQRQIFDAAGFGCSLLTAGKSPGTYAKIQLDEGGATQASRVGPASDAARAIVKRARALKAPR
ncbi:MAG: hypothetical protein JWP97_1846 [Labilithrix sp.]|nr:hypothetical protein [Labilithrix sp.]